MTRNEANAYLAVILEVVDASPHGAPAGALYAGMMGRIGLDDFHTLVIVAERARLLTSKHDVLTITDQGRATVAKLEAHRAAQVIGQPAPPADYRDGEWGH